MKRKTYDAGGPKIIKTSISLPDVLLKFAEGRCRDEGFNSFSAYVAHLVRFDKERESARKARVPATPPSSSPIRSEVQAFVEDELKRRKQKPPQS